MYIHVELGKKGKKGDDGQMSENITLQKKYIFAGRFNESHEGECLISVSLDYFILFHSGCVHTHVWLIVSTMGGGQQAGGSCSQQQLRSGGKENS